MAKSVKNPIPPSENEIEEDLLLSSLKHFGVTGQDWKKDFRKTGDVVWQGLYDYWCNYKKPPTRSELMKMLGFSIHKLRHGLADLISKKRIIRISSGVYIPVVE